MFWHLVGRMTTLWGLIFGLVLGVPWGVSAGATQVYVEENVLHLGVSAAPISLSEALSFGFSWPFVFGLFFGPIMGTIVGLIDGVVLYFLSVSYHNPPDNARRYRRSAGILCALVSPIPFFFGPFRLAVSEYTLFSGKFSGEFWLIALPLTVVYPSLIAMVVMWWAGRRVAGQWYRRESFSPSNYE